MVSLQGERHQYLFSVHRILTVLVIRILCAAAKRWALTYELLGWQCILFRGRGCRGSVEDKVEEGAPLSRLYGAPQFLTAALAGLIEFGDVIMVLVSIFITAKKAAMQGSYSFCESLSSAPPLQLLGHYNRCCNEYTSVK